MIISSQKYIDYTKVDEKIEELEGKNEVTLTAWDVDGEYAVLSDGHHAYQAAKELGINVKFEIVSHPEGLTGDDLLEQAWMDSDWYNVETGINVW